jgi:signal transduction histidine kinase
MENPIEILSKLTDFVQANEWRVAIDNLVKTWRKAFIFDNLAVFIPEEHGNTLTAVYARSLGRGRRSEADASWGETLANTVMKSGKLEQFKPEGSQTDNRISTPYILGLPLESVDCSGVLTIIRFGGPEFSNDHIHLARIFAQMVENILERKTHIAKIIQLENIRNQTQLQEDFIASISHDLNTPLGFIKGYTSSLLRLDVSWDEETTREFLTIIDDETDRLIGVIQSLLDSARLKDGKLLMKFHSISLKSCIGKIVDRYKVMNKISEIHFQMEKDIKIEADDVRLSQVFVNLIDNNIKYALGSPLWISVKKQKASVKIDFKDTGPGIDAEDLPFIFERYYRVPGNTDVRGSGLGLFICNELIQAHHGTISVSSSKGKGTIFHIKLPLKQAAEGTEF